MLCEFDLKTPLSFRADKPYTASTRASIVRTMTDERCIWRTPAGLGPLDLSALACEVFASHDGPVIFSIDVRDLLFELFEDRFGWFPA
jgi:hypothetical protein